MSAVLVLEDGKVFTGVPYGAIGQTLGEAVFCTGMSGYVTDDEISEVMGSIRQSVFDLCFDYIRQHESA